MSSDPVADSGWQWAHDFILGLVQDQSPEIDVDRQMAFDVAAAAVLVAYRAGLREGYVRAGVEPPAEEPFSDSDVTEQMRRYDESFADGYGFTKKGSTVF